MSRVFVVLATIFAVVVSKQEKLRVIASDLEQQQSLTAPVEFLGDYSAHASKKYSSSSELTSLAHSSAQQAKTAVRNQQTAGLQASIGAQSGYAKAAQEAASTAFVALIAKRVIIQNLEQQIEESAHNLLAEEAQYRRILEAASAAQQASQQTQQQLTVTTAALAAVQQTASLNERTAAAASQAVATQQQMIQDAQQRLSLLHQKLNEALLGLQETQLAAQKAAEAAQLAQNNAQSSIYFTKDLH